MVIRKKLSERSRCRKVKINMTENIENIKKVAVPPEEFPKNEKQGFAGKVTEMLQKKISEKINPNSQEVPKKEEKKPAYEGQQTEKLFDIKDLTSNLTPKKIVKLLGLLVLIVAIFGALYVKFIRKTPIRTTTTLISIPTPTYSPYQKYKPSIYADDVNFKKIDEGINVLSNEVKNTPLEDRSLLPPSLDMNIDLK